MIGSIWFNREWVDLIQSGIDLQYIPIGGGNRHTPIYVSTFCTAVCGTRWWFWRKLNAHTPAALTATCFFHGRRKISATPEPRSAHGEWTLIVNGWQMRRHVQERWLRFERMDNHWKQWCPSSNSDACSLRQTMNGQQSSSTCRRRERAGPVFPVS